jgi:hypothetical protein
MLAEANSSVKRPPLLYPSSTEGERVDAQRSEEPRFRGVNASFHPVNLLLTDRIGVLQRQERELLARLQGTGKRHLIAGAAGAVETSQLFFDRPGRESVIPRRLD